MSRHHNVDPKQTSEFINEEFAALVDIVSEMHPQHVNQILSTHPEAKTTFAALVLLFEKYTTDGGEFMNIDDWECDLADRLPRPSDKRIQPTANERRAYGPASIHG